MPRLLLACLISLLIAALAPATASMDDPATQVASLVNSVREQYGLPPLTLSAQLTASAQNYAETMGRWDFFGHRGPDGSRFDTRDEAAGYLDWTFLAENLAAGQPTAARAVSTWLADPQHLADLLSPLARETGVGFALAPGSKYVYYWVQEFGNRPAADVNPPPATVNPSPTTSIASVLLPSLVPWPYRWNNPGLIP
jgi:uncharacterized protein YkwD